MPSQFQTAFSKVREQKWLTSRALPARRYWIFSMPATFPGGVSLMKVHFQPSFFARCAAMWPNCAGKFRWTYSTCMSRLGRGTGENAKTPRRQEERQGDGKTGRQGDREKMA